MYVNGDVTLTGSSVSTDGSTTPAIQNMLYSDSTSSWNRQRGNTQGTLLASAARTATTVSPSQTNYNAKGLLLFLDITVASGTGGLQVQVRGKDPVTNKNININVSPTAITASGIYAYEIYPGASAAGTAGPGGVNQRTAAILPRTFDVAVFHVDSSSYTYSLGFALDL